MNGLRKRIKFHSFTEAFDLYSYKLAHIKMCRRFHFTDLFQIFSSRNSINVFN